MDLDTFLLYQTSKNNNSIRCSKCGTVINTVVPYCPNCGAQLFTDEQIQQNKASHDKATVDVLRFIVYFIVFIFVMGITLSLGIFSVILAAVAVIIVRFILKSREKKNDKPENPNSLFYKNKKLKIFLIIVIIVSFVIVLGHGLTYSSGDNIQVTDYSSSGGRFTNGSYYYSFSMDLTESPTESEGWSIIAIYKDPSGNILGEKTRENYISDFFISELDSDIPLNISTVTIMIKNPQGEIKYNNNFNFDMSKVDNTIPTN